MLKGLTIILSSKLQNIIDPTKTKVIRLRGDAFELYSQNVIPPFAVLIHRLIPLLMLPHADPAGAKPRRDHRSLAHMSRHEVPMTVGEDDPGKDIRPRQGVALTSLAMSATPWRGRGIACVAWPTGLRGYAPRPRGYEAGTHKGCFVPHSSQ